MMIHFHVLTTSVTLLCLLYSNAQAYSRTAGATPCCFKSQFEGFIKRDITIFRDRLQTTSTESRLFYDHSRKRVSNELFIPNIGPVRVVTDFASHQTFTILKRTGTCFQKTNTEILRPHCIPENATYEGKVTIRGFGKDISMNRWSAYIGQDKINYIVTDIGCVPVQFAIYSDKMQQLNFFYNITQGIRDPSVFDTPATCMQDTNSPGNTIV